MMTKILNRFTKDNFLAAPMVNHINAKRLPGNRVSKAMHIASRLVNGYKDLSTLVAVEEDSGAELAIAEFVAKHRRPPSKAKVDGHTVPVEGIMAVLAVARLLADTDCLGGSFANAGFVVRTGADGTPASVRAVKIDTGWSFNFSGAENVYYQSLHPQAQRKMKDRRDIQFGNNQTYEIEFAKLLPEQQFAFMTTFNSGMQHLCRDRSSVQDSAMYALLWQDGRFNKGKDRIKPVEVERACRDWFAYLDLLAKTYAPPLEPAPAQVPAPGMTPAAPTAAPPLLPVSKVLAVVVV